ncbi:MAG: sugar ABC transporter permease [Phycisphaeraceae bacterium]|nr:MAG: sugar ABC transporter permease [Phycisphaeraceae bacterium]
MSARKHPRRVPEWMVGLAFISPWIVGFLAFMALPIGMSLYYSMTQYTMLEPPIWVGADNYVAMAQDRVFWTVIWNTALYALVAIPVGTVLSVIIAVLLNTKVRGLAFFRAAVFVPTIVPLVAAAMVWMWLFNGELGLINAVLDAVFRPINAVFGTELAGPNWLGSARWVMPALILMSFWSVGQAVVIYVAALKDVPQVLYEAAELDGMGVVGRFVHVTLPMISPVILFNVIIGIINTWQIFAVPYIMLGTTGAAKRSGYFYTMYLYDKAFPFGEMGYASALAWVQLLIILALTGLTFLVSKKFVYYRAA